MNVKEMDVDVDVNVDDVNVNEMNYLECLTEELILSIFEFCLIEDQNQLAFVSQKCRRLVKDKSLFLKDNLLDRAMVEIEKQNYDSALKILRQILNVFPDAPDVWKEIALCYKQKENIPLALESLFQARKYADVPYKYFIQSQILLYIKKDGGHLALAEINKAIESDNQDLRYYHFRAFIESGLYREDDKEKKDQAHQEQIETLRAQSLEKELQDYEYIRTRSYKRMAAIYNNMGAVHFEKGDNQLALELFDKSTLMCSYYLQAYYNRAIVYKEMNNVSKALAQYNLILEMNPNYKRIYTLRGQCNYSLGMYMKALDDFLISLEGDKIEPDTVMGLYKSMIRTKQLPKTLPVLNQIATRMHNIIDHVKAEKESLDVLMASRSAHEEDDLFRFEAKEKMLAKMKKDTLDVLQIALRYTIDIHLLNGEFKEAQDCIDHLTANSLTYNEYFVESLIELGKQDLIPQEVKKYTWSICSQIGYSVLFSKALRLLQHNSPEQQQEHTSPQRTGYDNIVVEDAGTDATMEVIDPEEDRGSLQPPLLLLNPHQQFYFISCYAYFYLCIHTPRRQNGYQAIIQDLKSWLYTGTEKVLLPSHGIALSRLCRYPFALVHILEIFKKTRGSLDLRERTLLTLLDAISEKRHQTDREFERFTNRLIGKTITTTFAGPHFRADYF